MSRCGLFAGFLAASLALTVAPRVRAQASAEDRAAADTLYEESAKLMQEKRWAEACAKLETSQRLDPGIGTQLRLGYCLLNVNDGKGKTASAWAAFNEAEGMARKANDKRADEAAKQAKLLEPKLSKLLVNVAPESQAAGIEVRRDGKTVDPGTWGLALPVDPGAHTLEASKPGKQAWKTTFEVEAKPGVTTVRVPALADAPAEEAKAAPLATRTWRAQRIIGASVAGAGIVHLAIGAALGGLALSKNSASKAPPFCLASQPSLCTAEGAALRRSADVLRGDGRRGRSGERGAGRIVRRTARPWWGDDHDAGRNGHLRREAPYTVAVARPLYGAGGLGIGSADYAPRPPCHPPAPPPRPQRVWRA